MLTKKLMAVIMSAAALTVTACSSSTDNAVSDSTATPGASGNSMSVAVTGQFSNLDPGLNTETNNSYVLSHLYSAMFRRDTDGSIVPMLAEDYTISEDGLVWTFTLKDGLKWSDGTDLTAYDFEYTYLRNLSYGADNAFAVYNLVQYIEGADVYSEKAYATENFDCTKEDFSYVGVSAVFLSIVSVLAPKIQSQEYPLSNPSQKRRNFNPLPAKTGRRPVAKGSKVPR